MKIAIVGSRECDYAAVEREISAALVKMPVDTVVVSGGARGVDLIARRCANRLGLEVVEYLPEWELLGKRAGFLRNQQIVDACDELHAWWDGKSRGTKHSIDLARKAGKKVSIHELIP